LRYRLIRSARVPQTGDKVVLCNLQVVSPGNLVTQESQAVTRANAETQVSIQVYNHSQFARWHTAMSNANDSINRYPSGSGGGESCHFHCATVCSWAWLISESRLAHPHHVLYRTHRLSMRTPISACPPRLSADYSATTTYLQAPSVWESSDCNITPQLCVRHNAPTMCTACERQTSRSSL
jgi:hypothetical protein